MSFVVVGVDCATTEERTGLAYGVVERDGPLELKRVTLGTAGESAAATVASWLTESTRYVVALDAPLGWPAVLGPALSAHRAGEPVEGEAERLFRRDTDRFVHAELGKLPLEVGADRIARTARAALDLLQEIREVSSKRVPLLWKPGRGAGAIEVYPAATLLSRGISPRGYKGDTSAGRKAREDILDRLGSELCFARSHDRDPLVDNDHMLDAAICAVAAADFARGDALAPEDSTRAKREGWIWFRGRGQRALF
jgi:predicted RNase H-like nuclease